MQPLVVFLVLLELLVPDVALTADADSGRRLAEARCVPCHVIAPGQTREVREAPPFASIAKKFGSNPDLLSFALRDPHPRMNVTLTPREMQDVAAFINTLAD
jgi:mono/diheme cytochrome c family protein